MTDLIERLRSFSRDINFSGAAFDAEIEITRLQREAAELRAERDSARNDEWLAAISAVQYMEANWFQDCRSEVERSALQSAAEEIISELRRSGPTEYLDLKWKDAKAAVAAEARAETAERQLAERDAELARVRGELQKEADRAYCRFLDKMSGRECLGEDAKLRDGKFGKAELDAHRAAYELHGIHLGLNKALATLSAHPQPAQAGGWRLVPVEPTYEMKMAGERQRWQGRSTAADIYRAMLPAAPTPAPAEGR